MIIGLLLIAAALLLTVYNVWDSERAGKVSDAVTEKLKLEIGNQNAENTGEMPMVRIDGNDYIGLLEIPSLELALPVMADWSYEKLQISPCRYAGSYYNDDLVIAGHNYIRHFSSLKRVEIGADVYFTNAAGEVFHYAVSNVETLQPAQVEDMVNGDWDLTLFTCNIGGRSRCTVRCIREE